MSPEEPEYQVFEVDGIVNGSPDEHPIELPQELIKRLQNLSQRREELCTEAASLRQVQDNLSRKSDSLAVEQVQAINRWLKPIGQVNELYAASYYVAGVDNITPETISGIHNRGVFYWRLNEQLKATPQPVLAIKTGKIEIVIAKHGELTHDGANHSVSEIVYGWSRGDRPLVVDYPKEANGDTSLYLNLDYAVHLSTELSGWRYVRATNDSGRQSLVELLGNRDDAVTPRVILKVNGSELSMYGPENLESVTDLVLVGSAAIGQFLADRSVRLRNCDEKVIERLREEAAPEWLTAVR